MYEASWPYRYGSHFTPMVSVEHTPLIGRDRELSAFTRLLDEARRGYSGVVLVAGEPGIGRTRLLLEVAQRARAADWDVLVGRAYDSEGMPPYLPFIEALHDYLRTCRPEAARAHLEALPPRWCVYYPTWHAAWARRRVGRGRPRPNA
jgi:hypothetical protein